MHQNDERPYLCDFVEIDETMLWGNNWCYLFFETWLNLGNLVRSTKTVSFSFETLP